MWCLGSARNSRARAGTTAWSKTPGTASDSSASSPAPRTRISQLTTYSLYKDGALSRAGPSGHGRPQRRKVGEAPTACRARAQVARQLDRPVADAQQAAHLEPHRLKQAPHLTVTPFVQHHPERAVAAGLPFPVFRAGLDVIEARRSVGK